VKTRPSLIYLVLNGIACIQRPRQPVPWSLYDRSVEWDRASNLQNRGR
jgi:hypothetical protein